MNKLFIVGVVVSLLLALSFVSAQTIENYDLDVSIVNDKAVVEHTMSSTSPMQGLKIRIPADASAITLYNNGKKTDFLISEGLLSLPYSSDIRFNYITEEYIDNENFVFGFTAPADIDSLDINLLLPENAALKRPFSRGDLTTGSAFPSPDQALSDGKSIVLVWNTQLKKGDEMPIFVGYKERMDYLFWVILLLILLILAALYIIFKKPIKEIVVKKEESIEQHLKEEEEQVVNIIKQREDHKIEQGTLRVITGFSKATLSRLLKELEDRKVIYKEKRGKKNLVFLKR